MKKAHLLLVFVVIAIFATSCVKKPSEFTITYDKDTVRVNEPVTFTINDLEDYMGLNWYCSGYDPIESNAKFISKSYGGTSDLTWSLEFLASGESYVQVIADNQGKETDFSVYFMVY